MKAQGIGRRQALVVVGATVATLYGKPVSGNQRGLTLALDAVDAIVLQYRGRTVAVTPDQILDALDASPAYQMKAR